MAWDKDVCFVELVTPVTGASDTTSHAVKFQPVDSAYPTGSIAGVAGTSNAARYYPASDLSESMHYDIYVDGVRVGRLQAINSYSAIGV